MELKLIVPPTHRGSKITVLGEAAGEEEEYFKQGWVGPAGRLLRHEFKKIGINLDECNLSNVVKYRPPNNNFGVFLMPKGKSKKPTLPGPELLEWYELLRQELIEHRPNVVVACGQHAVDAMLGYGHKISNIRGHIYQSTLVPGLTVVPIAHPSYILHKAKWQEIYITEHILETKVKLASEYPVWKYLTWSQIVQPSLDLTLDFLDGLIASSCDYALDIETRGRSISCIGIGDERGCVCIPIQTTKGPYWTPEEESLVWDKIDELLNTNPNLIWQNGLYDGDWLMDYGIVPRNIKLDLMLGWHILHPELPKKLQFINMWYNGGDIPYYKDEGKTWTSKTPNEQEWQYNIRDIMATIWASQHVLRELKQTGKDKIYYGRTQQLLPIAFEMQHRGMRVNDGAFSEAYNIVNEELQQEQLILDAMIGKSLNINSPKQLQNFVYNDLKLPVKKSKGKVTVDEDALTELMLAHPELPVLKHILKKNKLETIVSNYINAEFEKTN